MFWSPVDTHVLRVTLYDLHRLSGRIPLKYPKRLVSGDLDPEQFEDLPPDEWRTVPVKIALGNGIDWLIVISLNLGNSGRSWINPITIQPRLIGLVSGSSVLVSFDAKRKSEQMIDLLSILGGCSVSLMGFVDLGVLSVMAGWRLSARSPTCMAA